MPNDPLIGAALTAATPEVAGSSPVQLDPHVGTTEDLLRLLVDSVADYAIFLLDTEGRIVSWNTGAERIKGWTADEIIGRHFSTFYPEVDVRSGKPEWELLVAADTGRFEDEGWRVRKDGSRLWASVIITALRDKRGSLRGFGKVTRDLTARRDLELERLDRQRKEAERLRSYAQRLSELESAKTEFLNLASHELRGPLAVARGYVTMLEDGSLTPEEFAERAGIVAGKLAEIESLVQKMLETARLEHGELTLKAQAVNVADLVSEQVRAFEVFLDEAHPLHVNIAPDLPQIQGDPDRLGAVVLNLLDNAAKYSPHGGRIDVKVAASPEHVFISVADKGLGIQPDSLPQLFTRFARLHETEFPSIGGTGLGLYLAREIARKHGGDIIVETRPGEGSRFTVSIPVNSKAIPPAKADPLNLHPGGRRRAHK